MLTLFVVIYPGNRVLVDYHGRYELVRLAAIDIESGQEIDPILEAARLGFTPPKELEMCLDDALALREFIVVD